MPKNETILNRAEVAKEFGISEHIVARYIDSGELQYFKSGSGSGISYMVPMSAAEALLGPYRTALTMAAMVAESGLTESALRGALDAGKLPTLRPKTGSKSTVYVARSAFDRYMAERKAKEQPALKLVPASAPTELPADVTAQAKRAADEQALLRLLDDRMLSLVARMDRRDVSDDHKHEELIVAFGALSKEFGDVKKALGDLAAAIELRLGELPAKESA